MDFTKKNKIRDKGFDKISNIEYKLLYRQDTEQIFTEMIKEKNLNHYECIVIRTFLEGIIGNPNAYHEETKTSYYHVARELYDKIRLSEDDYLIRVDIAKRHKLNINEINTLDIYMASIVCLGLTTATLKNNF